MLFRKSIITLVVVSALILLFAGSAYGSEFEVKYVYYENADEDMVRVDYAAALAGKDLFSGDGGILYDATVEAVRDALGNFREVWVAVSYPSTEEVDAYVKHSESLMQGLTLAEAIHLEGEGYYFTDEDDFPDYDLELVVQDGEAVEKSADELLDDIIVVWDDIGEQWLVFVTLEDGVNASEVKILGKEARYVKDSDPEKWLLQLEEVRFFEGDAPVVTENDIEITE